MQMLFCPHCVLKCTSETQYNWNRSTCRRSKIIICSVTKAKKESILYFRKIKAVTYIQMYKHMHTHRHRNNKTTSYIFSWIEQRKIIFEPLYVFRLLSLLKFLCMYVFMQPSQPCSLTVLPGINW